MLLSSSRTKDSITHEASLRFLCRSKVSAPQPSAFTSCLKANSTATSNTLKYSEDFQGKISTSYHHPCWYRTTILFNLIINSLNTASKCKCYFPIISQHVEIFINTWFHPEICLSKWLRIISIENILAFKAKILSIIRKHCFFSPTTWVLLNRSVQGEQFKTTLLVYEPFATELSTI